MKTQDEYLRTIEVKIAQYGWALQGVFPTEQDPGPSFIYTVGLSGFRQHPELITFGLPYEAAGQMLNDLGRRVKDGQDFRAGQELLDVANMPCRLINVRDVRPYMTVARRLFRRVRGLQLVWPDTEGVFPWEDAYAIGRDVQPVLGDWNG